MSRYSVSRRYWTEDKIVAAFHAWEREHGKAPGQEDWLRATPHYPAAQTVRDVFGSFTAGRNAAGLTYVRINSRGLWDRQSVVEAIFRWSFEHGRPPAAHEWHVPPPGWPRSYRVRQLFGGWNAALVAAGYEPRWTKKSKKSFRAQIAAVTKAGVK